MTWDDLKNEPTETLIEFIKCKNDAYYKKLAEVAFVAFTMKFRGEIIHKCRTIGRYWGYDNDTADMLAEWKTHVN